MMVEFAGCPHCEGGFPVPKTFSPGDRVFASDHEWAEYKSEAIVLGHLKVQERVFYKVRFIEKRPQRYHTYCYRPDHLTLIPHAAPKRQRDRGCDPNSRPRKKPKQPPPPLEPSPLGILYDDLGYPL